MLEERLSLATEAGLLLSDPTLTSTDSSKLPSLPLSPETFTGAPSSLDILLRPPTEDSDLMREELCALHFILFGSY